MAYLLDTNVFIEAKNRWYGFVADEIQAGDDELVPWIRACVAMDVKYINVFAMLRLEKARFVLEPGSSW
jgi:hypothetical protein